MSGPSAPWRSGYAAACKAVYTGSIPVGASSRRDASHGRAAIVMSQAPAKDERELRTLRSEVAAQDHVIHVSDDRDRQETR